MKVKLLLDWKGAAKGSFSPDVIRRSATPFRNKKLMCIVPKESDAGNGDLKQWFINNEVKEVTMFGVYDVQPDGKVFYQGLAFDFKNENDIMMFKLTFM